MVLDHFLAPAFFICIIVRIDVCKLQNMNKWKLGNINSDKLQIQTARTGSSMYSIYGSFLDFPEMWIIHKVVVCWRISILFSWFLRILGDRWGSWGKVRDLRRQAKIRGHIFIAYRLLWGGIVAKTLPLPRVSVLKVPGSWQRNNYILFN